MEETTEKIREARWNEKKGRREKRMGEDRGMERVKRERRRTGKRQGGETKALVR